MADVPVTLLLGSEVFSRRQRLAELVRQDLPDGLNDFNYVRLDARETGIVDILSTWEERSFGGGRRVIHVENIDKLRLKKDDRAADLFLKRVRKGNPQARLVLEAESIDRRKGFFKKLAAACTVEEFQPLREHQLPGFIRDYLGRKGYGIAPDAVAFFASLASSELMVVAGELDKLVLYLGDDRKEITLADVQDLLMPSRTYTHFDLQDALAAGDREHSLRILSALLADGTPDIVLWRFLGNLMERAWRLSEAKSREDLAAISRSSFYLGKIQQLADRFPKGRLEPAVVLGRKLEMNARGGAMSPGFYLAQYLHLLFRMMR